MYRLWWPGWWGLRERAKLCYEDEVLYKEHGVLFIVRILA